MIAQENDRGQATRIAIVEDSDTLRRYLSERIAEIPGYQCVCVCASAEEALAVIPDQRPDVVLMDIQLPGQSGIACTVRLRQKMPKVQVIVLTVYKDIDLIFQALKAGACGYLLKRADETQILKAIAEVRAGGAPMTSQVARMVVRSFMKLPSGGSELVQLSPRELEILEGVAKGLSDKEVGDMLGIAIGTVRAHLNHIYEKLHVRCRTEAAVKYLSAPDARNVPSAPF
jgi:DNA-binding NarL/FixJ family response regulator